MLPLYVTGVRSGEIIVAGSSAKQCRGSILKIRGFYPPSVAGLDELTPADFRDRFENIPFFHAMTSIERKLWLYEHATTNSDLYLQDVDIQVKVIQYSGDFINKALTPEQITTILAGNPEDPEGYWPIKTLYNMFPRKPGSRAHRHTLVFRPGNWCLREERVSTGFEGRLIYLDNGEIEMGHVKKNYLAIEHSLGTAAIVYPDSSTMPTIEQLLERMAELDLEVSNLHQIHQLIKWMPPSVHKSLIQKIIRTRARTVTYHDLTFSGDEVLAVSFCTLIIHPGAFVPNIQRFVSGLESATKRLAVSINEDSYLDDGGPYLTTLYATACLVQNTPWFPSIDLIVTWVSAGIAAIANQDQYDYDVHKSTNRVKVWNNHGVNYYLLANIKSFELDINMLDITADRNGRPRPRSSVMSRYDMPIIHSIDHHSYTDIAHYLDPTTVMKFENYHEVFQAIWQQVTGVNVRHDTFVDTPFALEVRRAQQAIWTLHTVTPKPADVTNEVTDLDYQLSSEWLAAMVGPIEYRLDGGVSALVMMSPNDLYDYVAIKRPSRTTGDNPELTEDEKSRAINKFRADLMTGIPLKHVPDSLPQFKGQTVRLVDQEYFLDKTSWEEAMQLHLVYPIHDYSLHEPLLFDALENTGDGIHVLASEKIEQFLETVPRSALQRAMNYLGRYQTEIEIYHIGRDGTGTEYSVAKEDTWVNYLLGAVAALYPAALVKHKQKYRVKSGPLMWTLAKYIQAFLEEEQTVTSRWPLPKADTRELWDHQLEAVERLHAKSGLRIIWIPPGLGKTLIIATYISDKIKAKTMLKYCLYTLPPSAMTTIQKELDMLGLPYVHLDMRQSGGGKKQLQPWKINIVYHDHLRMADLENIRDHGSNLLFVNDEFHKTVSSGTQRTSLALEISRLARETIAMTGTLIRDDKTVDLIEWLQGAVEFEVTPNNFWVAISSIISRKVQTSVVVERIIHEAIMSDDERRLYLATIPKEMGGTARTINFREAVRLSYLAITREIVELIKQHLDVGLGVFIVARNIEHQKELQQLLIQSGITSIFLIGKDRSISLTPADEGPEVVITTPHHAEGYNLTKFRVMLMPVVFSNQATRDQLERRINRIGQTAESIRIVILHAGILSRIHEHYEKARSFAAALKGFAKETNLQLKELQD